MVKFGAHIDALSHGDLRKADAWLVPYDEIKSQIFENPDSFVDKWKSSLRSAEDQFRDARKQVWQIIFERISSEAEEDYVRGSHPGHALQLYAENVHPEKARELLLKMTQIHQTAFANSEGLRKLVKKYDKHRGGLSIRLLPELYTSSLYSGQETLKSSITFLRDLLDEESEFQPLVKRDSEFRHDQIIEDRIGEIDWLKRLVATMRPLGILSQFVAHRGFHHIKDRNDKRPIENSLSAYEIAWTAGIELCECDIAMTKDEKLILAHDENFMRLALDSNSEYSSRHVSDLTFREIMGLPLKSGVRPPLLIDVLRSATAISSETSPSKLVIELKPGNEAAASALSRLLIRHPELCPSVAMIMSFDAVMMHRLRTELSVLDDVADPTSRLSLSPGPTRRITSHKRISSFDHFGTARMSVFGSNPGLSHFDHNPSSIGLSLSSGDLHDQDSAMDNGPVSLRSKANSLIPKLMLLTVADPPKIACEQRVSVDDFSPVESLLKGSDGQLDGVYLQWEENMMTEEGARHLSELSQRCLVGIWTYSGKDPDDFNTYQFLVKKGNCTFVNTDLPNHFHKDVPTGKAAYDFEAVTLV